MDITDRFHKALERRDKNAAIKKNIFPKKKSPFATAAIKIFEDIESLRSLLLEHKQEYIDPKRHLYSEAAVMTDRERDEIDAKARMIIQKCTERIDKLKNELSKLAKEKRDYNVDVVSHFLGIVGFLYLRVQSVSEIFGEMRSIRLRRFMNEAKDGYLKLPVVKSGNRTIVSSSIPYEDKEDETDPIVITDEEKKLFQAENQALVNEITTLTDQAREVEQKVMEISHMQHFLSTKIAEQDEMLQDIYNSVVMAQSNVDDGIVELEKATKTGVNFRVFILLFLIIASLALLFLDRITP